MLQEKIAIRHNVVALPAFIDQNVAAEQTNAQLVVGAAPDQDGVLALMGGYVVGMSVQLNAAATAGSLTVGVSIDGTEDADTTQTITTEQEVMAKFEIGVDAPRFEAGEQIGVGITTGPTWDGPTADLMVVVYVLYEDWQF